MMVMTAKLNLKKILLVLGAAAAVVLSLILVLGGNPDTPAAPSGEGNAARVKFLRDQGWEVSDTPMESSQVRVPETTSQIYERYNNLQKSQGYDLSRYAGEKVMRYVYEIRNLPGATAPVYATLLVCKNQIIGGDITDTGVGGKIRGILRTKTDSLPKPEPTLPAETVETTQSATLPQVQH